MLVFLFSASFSFPVDFSKMFNLWEMFQAKDYFTHACCQTQGKKRKAFQMPGMRQSVFLQLLCKTAYEGTRFIDKEIPGMSTVR